MGLLGCVLSQLRGEAVVSRGDSEEAEGRRHGRLVR